MKKTIAAVAIFMLTLAASNTALADTGLEERVGNLEKQVEALLSELREAKEKLEEAKARPSSSADDEIKRLSADVEALKNDGGSSASDSFSFGGYGEMHANFVEGDSEDQFDIHRLVLYLGYDFADWIKLDSEIEVEHAYVSKSSGGELSIEQLYLDFLLHDAINIRAGRMLAPLGITNMKHEPPSFNGVERPSFDKYIIPTTWSVDGAGLFGDIAEGLRYQLYAVAGLDGSKFSAKDGIRGGRIKERSSFNDIAVTGRLDFYPLISSDMPYGQDLRLGASFYHGGIDNGNKGKDPGIDGSVTIYSGDMEAGLGDVDLRGAVAFTQIDGAEKLNGVAEEIFGYYVEAGYHFWPDSFKTGKLEHSDAVIFARFDDFDTQFKMPAGVAENPAGDRQEWTFGINFYPVPNLVLKADYQVRDSGAPEGLENLINFGIGWQL